MLSESDSLPAAFLNFEQELLAELKQFANVIDVASGTELLREGQYVSGVPMVLSGRVKVYSRGEDREFLLYYIEPAESCIMSFSASLSGDTSKIFALTEADSRILLLPTEQLPAWLRKYPRFSRFFFDQYHLRYDLLLEVVHQVLFERLDQRLWDYLLKKVELNASRELSISHREIATDLGSVREVISRMMKKLEREGKITQHQGIIHIL